MVLDGENWRAAIDRHRGSPDDGFIRDALSRYRAVGFTYLRDGGDRWGVGKRARALAPEYGITYRTPLAPLYKKGHYGGFIGTCYENLSEYSALVQSHRTGGGDFIKIMISGLMDFNQFGRLTEEPLTPQEIEPLITIAHDMGFSVMAHANGARCVQAAAQAGVDSVEHGAYLDGEALSAMVENKCVWVPTLSTVGNLRNRSRFREEAVEAILESAQENVHTFAAMGGLLAPGTDAGAWAVPHGGMTEYSLLAQAIGSDWQQVLASGTAALQCRF